MNLRFALGALLFLQAPGNSPGPVLNHFAYRRAVKISAQQRPAQQTCASLDAMVFEHAASESLNDLRLYSRGAMETPFVITESGPVQIADEAARVRNLGMVDRDVVFDLEMPHRPYTAVTLDLGASDFLAKATVSGSAIEGGAPVALGTYALFDFHAQGLSRSTTLPLQEATFPVLHVRLEMMPSPGASPQSFPASIVKGASVPPSREAQTLFNTVAETAEVKQRKKESVFSLHVPAHVPVERVELVLDPGFQKQFLRRVHVTARPDGMQDNGAVEAISGEISHTRLPSEAAGFALDQDVFQLSINAALGADLRQGATVEIAVENGDDAPLALRSARLQMRERHLCFEANPGDSYALMYGDPELHAPEYDYVRLFRAEVNAAKAVLEPQEANPSFARRTDERSYTERHPEVLWVALIAVVATLGSVAFRSAKRRH